VLIVPFLPIILLFINPLLLVAFQRLDINLQKYQFWVMVTSGLAWLISLGSVLFDPDIVSQQTSEDVFSLLDKPILIFDSLSSILIVGIAGLVFFCAFSQIYSPRQIALISTLSGFCSLGLLSGSAYTLLLFLPIIEGIRLFWIINSQGQNIHLRRKFLGLLFRMMSPLLLIYARLINQNTAGIDSFLSFQPETGFLLASAGLIGVVGWIDFLKGTASPIERSLDHLFELLPGSVGLMLLIRAAEVVPTDRSSIVWQTGLSIIILLSVLIGIFLKNRNFPWLMSCLGLILKGVLSGYPQDALVWSLVLIIAGFLFRFPAQNRSQAIWDVLFGSLSILPVPFLPAFAGTGLFDGGWQDLVLLISFGLAAGNLAVPKLLLIMEQRLVKQEIIPAEIVGPGFLFFSLYFVSVLNGLVLDSLSPLPVIWLTIPAAGVMIGIILFGRRFPSFGMERFEKGMLDLVEFSREMVEFGTTTFEGIINIATGLFEGEGGLIWALLIGFLIITLISVGGS
jgi:hypothetical protein